MVIGEHDDGIVENVHVPHSTRQTPPAESFRKCSWLLVCVCVCVCVFLRGKAEAEVRLDRVRPEISPTCVQEGILDVGSRLGGRFEKVEPVLLGEGFALLLGYGALRFQVGLVADEHDGHVGIGVLPGVFT